MARRPRVCIIGAGVSGLRCAEVLTRKGCPVKIFEARDRVGGRLHQATLDGHTIDMGPNWIHGTKDNPILDLANETNTLKTSIGEEAAAYDEYGYLIRDRLKVKEITETVWGIIADAFKLSNESSSIPANKSLFDFFIEEVEHKDLDENDKKLVLQMAHSWGAYVGDPVEKQSLKFFWMEECIDGENLFVSGTYKAILNHIAEHGLANAELQLSTEVTRIGYNHSEGRSRPVVYTNHAPSGIEFDALILTVPLGCLKAGLPTVTPPLPARLQSAIGNLSYGHLEKVYITFPAAFWDPKDGTTPLWPTFTHFLHPTYANEHNNPEAYEVECMSLASLPAEAAHPTLLFYIHGPFARSLATNPVLRDPSQEAYQTFLRETFEPYYSRLPGYDATNPHCIPVSSIITSWSADRFAGHGSYTNFQVIDDPQKGQGVRLDHDVEVLREGCPERGLWFAGEHTAPFVALGTVTGAYWSGEKAAERVVAWFEEGEHGDAAAATTSEAGSAENASSDRMAGKGEDGGNVQIGKFINGGVKGINKTSSSGDG